jgi:hypothetical protein
MTSNMLGRIRKTMGWCPIAEFTLKNSYVVSHDAGSIDKLKGNLRGDSSHFLNNEVADSQIRIEDDEVDVVSIGLTIIITGLLIISFAHYISDIYFISEKATIVQDKYSLIPNTIQSFGVMVFGLFVTIIGCAVFLRNFVNLYVDTLIQWLNR